MKYFNIEYRLEGNDIIVKLVGELDAHTSVLVDNKLDEAVTPDVKHVFVDCSELSYISSSGLGVLVSHFQSCTLQNITMVLCGVQPKVKSVLEVLGLQQIITIRGSLMEAIAEYSQPDNN